MEDQEVVVIISKSIVTPKNVNKSSTTIHLNPWDLSRLRFGYLQRGLLFHKPQDLNIETIISKLKASLSIALDHFYPLAGRLVKAKNQEDDSISFHITCDGLGVEFVHAMAKDIEISHVLALHGSITGFFGSFFPATGIKNYQGVTRSLLVVQVTEMKDGIFLGLGYNSLVSDGDSIWRFLNVWSEICSSDPVVSKNFDHSLDLKGWFFDEIEYPIHVQHLETQETKNGCVTSNNLQEKMLHITKENVLRLEAKANNEENYQKISSIEAVLGHIWCFMAKHNGMSRDEVTHCRLPINMRGRLEPRLKEECFGNVSLTGIAMVTIGELMDHGLGWTGKQINKMVASQTGEKAREFAKNWVKNVKIPVSVGSNDLVVTSSNDFDVYSNDFGWGKPMAARAGPPYVNGRLVVFRGIEEGSIDFQACLHHEVVEKLLMDVEFKEYVSIV